MQQLAAKHPRPVRWMHWINAIVLPGMIYSGLMIYWANDVYRIGWGDKTLVAFFPEEFYRWLRLDYRLALGIAWHFTLMWFFALNGICYVGYTILSGEWRYLVPGRHVLRDAWHVALHDLHLSSFQPPQRRFNAMQQIAYTGVILMGAGSLVTGLAIYKPTQLAWLDWLLGGYAMARWEHFWLTMGYVLFVIVHLIQVARAGWNNFRTMVTGFELVEAEELQA